MKSEIQCKCYCHCKSSKYLALGITFILTYRSLLYSRVLCFLCSRSGSVRHHRCSRKGSVHANSHPPPSSGTDRGFSGRNPRTFRTFFRTLLGFHLQEMKRTKTYISYFCCDKVSVHFQEQQQKQVGR